MVWSPSEFENSVEQHMITVLQHLSQINTQLEKNFPRHRSNLTTLKRLNGYFSVLQAKVDACQGRWKELQTAIEGWARATGPADDPDFYIRTNDDQSLSTRVDDGPSSVTRVDGDPSSSKPDVPRPRSWSLEYATDDGENEPAERQQEGRAMHSDIDRVKTEQGPPWLYAQRTGSQSKVCLYLPCIRLPWYYHQSQKAPKGAKPTARTTRFPPPQGVYASLQVDSVSCR